MNLRVFTHVKAGLPQSTPRKPTQFEIRTALRRAQAKVAKAVAGGALAYDLALASSQDFR